MVIAVTIASAVAGEPDLASQVLSLALPALVAGMLSVLSPCSLPIILGYFTVAFQEQRERIGLMTVVDPQTISDYARDGAVVIRGCFTPEQVDLVRAGVARNLAEPGLPEIDRIVAGRPRTLH
jgi:hypothetical protein